MKLSWSLLFAVAALGCSSPAPSEPEPGPDADTASYVGDGPSTTYERFELRHDGSYQAKRRDCTTALPCVETGSYAVDSAMTTITFRDDATGTTKTGKFDDGPALVPGSAQDVMPQGRWLIVGICMLLRLSFAIHVPDPAIRPDVPIERYVQTDTASSSCK
jgi:hypothetical protein